MNNVKLQGNLGADGELRHTQSGKALLRLRLATEENYMDDQGAWQRRPEWHTVVVWDKRAEGLAPRCLKGKPILVDGRLRTRSWEDKDGNKRSTTEVVAKKVTVFAGYAKSDGEPRLGGDDAMGGDDSGEFDGDIPF